MVKTRSQQKIAFPRRKAKSGSKSVGKSLDEEPKTKSRNCIASTLARVCRDKPKGQLNLVWFQSICKNLCIPCVYHDIFQIYKMYRTTCEVRLKFDTFEFTQEFALFKMYNEFRQPFHVIFLTNNIFSAIANLRIFLVLDVENFEKSRPSPAKKTRTESDASSPVVSRQRQTEKIQKENLTESSRKTRRILSYEDDEGIA